MPIPSSLQEIVEWRGVEGLVAAEVLTDDDSNGYTTGPVFAVAGVAEISRTTESSNEAHYYDNMPAVVISSTGSDELTISVSAIPFDVYAEITGQNYDSTSAMLIEGPRDVKYFALGYKTKKTNGDEVYVWRYKGTFNIPDQTNSTENDGTDANGQEIVYTGISTTHKFTLTGKGAKAANVDVEKSGSTLTTFFDVVTTPDMIATPGPDPAYKLYIAQASNTTVTVQDVDTEDDLSNGASLERGQVLKISVSGGTVEVNGRPYVSGTNMVVTSSVVVVSTASA